tara:strand:+ start:22 stop:357 length:336 start_codon:yes stop_codon:yes gene_type:complete
MIQEKRCKMCSSVKPISAFGNKKDNPIFFYATCKKCLRKKRKLDRTTSKNWKWPYAKGLYTMLKDPKYIKHKYELFNKHGNGWWWGDGYWNGKTQTIGDQTRKYKNNKKEA